MRETTEAHASQRTEVRGGHSGTSSDTGRLNLGLVQVLALRRVAPSLDWPAMHARGTQMLGRRELEFSSSCVHGRRGSVSSGMSCLLCSLQKRVCSRRDTLSIREATHHPSALRAAASCSFGASVRKREIAQPSSKVNAFKLAAESMMGQYLQQQRLPGQSGPP